MQLANSKTYRNLAATFAGESQARNRYKFMEYGARQQGFIAMADLIDNVEKNEFNHARMFYTHIQKASNAEIKNIDITAGYPFKQKWDLMENLRIAAEDEGNEVKLYTEFEKTATEEGFTDIAKLYRDTIQVENCHKMLFQQLYDQMKSGTMYKQPNPVKWKCADCGYEAIAKEAWKICPLCEAKQGAVMLQIQD